MTPKKIAVTEPENENKKPSINSTEWTDYVLNLLSEDEKIQGNPTTDGLRRIFEIALDCDLIESITDVIQSPEPNNEKRATVTHTLKYLLKTDASTTDQIKYRVVTGSADVYWGNCDKIYRNHPVAVAETRAEGRALRRALRLRKVVAAEELAKDIEDHPDNDSVSKISNNQINFMDVLAKRLDIDMVKLLAKYGHADKNIYNIEHSVAVDVIKNLSSYQQDMNNISDDIRGYDTNWK